jgi:hypothetical protein
MDNYNEKLVDILDKKYQEFSSKVGRPLDRFPFGFINEDSGIPYLKIDREGKPSILANDRGQECFRKEFTSIDDMVKWVFEDSERRREIWSKFK